VETKTFIVHYEETDRNLTTEQNPENAVFRDAVAEGDNSPVHGDVVGSDQAGPSSPSTPHGNASQTHGWATSSDQNSSSSEEGP
jgi:hypothetical protein